MDSTDVNCLFDVVLHQGKNYNNVKAIYTGMDLMKQMIKYMK